MDVKWAGVFKSKRWQVAWQAFAAKSGHVRIQSLLLFDVKHSLEAVDVFIKQVQTRLTDKFHIGVETVYSGIQLCCTYTLAVLNVK